MVQGYRVLGVEFIMFQGFRVPKSKERATEFRDTPHSSKFAYNFAYIFKTGST